MSPVRALAIVGPTAAGKSQLAMALATQLDLPILCCDSVQVYRGLDIGSAKPSHEDRGAVRHELLDLVDPDEEFSAHDYASRARSELERGPAILCGGTGLYLRATGWQMTGEGARSSDHGPPLAPDRGPERDAFERAWMTREAEAPGTIHRELGRRDPPTADGIHPNNRVHALRALWLCERYRAPISEVRGRNPLRALVELMMILVDPGIEAVDAAIEARCEAMLTRGWVAEVEKLRSEGYDERHKAMRSLGYRELLEYLAGRCTLDQAQAAIVRATRKYARRQRTYFRHQFRDLLAMERILNIQHPDACPVERVDAFLRGASL